MNALFSQRCNAQQCNAQRRPISTRLSRRPEETGEKSPVQTRHAWSRARLDPPADFPDRCFPPRIARVRTENYFSAAEAESDCSLTRLALAGGRLHTAPHDADSNLY